MVAAPRALSSKTSERSSSKDSVQREVRESSHAGLLKRMASKMPAGYGLSNWVPRRQPATAQGVTRRTSDRSQEGRVVQVGDLAARISCKLGTGSYGVVYEVTLPDGKVAALKEIVISNAFPLENAVREALVLKALRSASAVPRHIAHQATSGGHELHILMDKAPGGCLDLWIYNRDTAQFKDLDPRGYDCLEEFGGMAGTMHPTDAMVCARQMLLQLSPAMTVLDQVAFHRDINAHNVLIESNGGRYRFSLIDFGMTTEADPWRAGGWRQADIGGDPRYWAPPVWMLYLEGLRSLDVYGEKYQKQYTTRLDCFAVGLMALEMFVVLSVRAEDAQGDDAELKALHSLQKAFIAYWKWCLLNFQLIMRDHGGRLSEVRSVLQRQDIVRQQLELLGRLVSRLKKLALASPRLRLFLCACVELISPEGVAMWTDIPGVLDGTVDLAKMREAAAAEAAAAPERQSRRSQSSAVGPTRSKTDSRAPARTSSSRDKTPQASPPDGTYLGGAPKTTGVSDSGHVRQLSGTFGLPYSRNANPGFDTFDT